ncbi:MAG: diadenylate cyclase [Puniceicoccales bacterium]|jgi:DNA integrity scanning protein DisA with diadenylate cyclase activity/mannitol/fructose-specific phosphotransferase system IIA component|nr:diadenylate cyclase [Puniceicoccales bacterium]
MESCPQWSHDLGEIAARSQRRMGNVEKHLPSVNKSITKVSLFREKISRRNGLSGQKSTVDYNWSMQLTSYFARDRLINIHDNKLEGALRELLRTFSPTLGLDHDKIIEELLLKERQTPTNLGNGIAIPHLTFPMRRPCLIAIGRCYNGLQCDLQSDYGEVRILILILFSESGDRHLPVLANLARELHDPQKVLSLTREQTLAKFYENWVHIFRQKTPRLDVEQQQRKGQRVFLKEAFQLALSSECQSIFLFPDALNDWFAFGQYFRGLNRVLISERLPEDIPSDCEIDHMLTISNYSDMRLMQMHSAILLALSRHLISHNEKICCIGSSTESRRFDCLLVMDVAAKYKSLLNTRRGLIPKDVKPEVFERIVAIAHEIAMEGREGKPLGAMFILGNHGKLRSYYRSLILNPFQGYPRQERNVLNPFIDETIKEFASLDGAFIVDGDGVLEAAGTMVTTPDQGIILPGGLGTRHMSAAAISKATDSIAVVISQSTNQVTIFRNGQMLPLSEKIIG